MDFFVNWMEVFSQLTKDACEGKISPDTLRLVLEGKNPFPAEPWYDWPGLYSLFNGCDTSKLQELTKFARQPGTCHMPVLAVQWHQVCEVIEQMGVSVTMDGINADTVVLNFDRRNLYVVVLRDVLQDQIQYSDYSAARAHGEGKWATFTECLLLYAATHLREKEFPGMGVRVLCAGSRTERGNRVPTIGWTIDSHGKHTLIISTKHPESAKRDLFPKKVVKIIEPY